MILAGFNLILLHCHEDANSNIKIFFTTGLCSMILTIREFIFE